MRDPVKLPTTDDPLEAWCVFCAERGLEPGEAYCAECRPAYSKFRERLSQRPALRIARALFGNAPVPVSNLSPSAPRTRLK
ncbi:MAG: hypothetical protein LAO51_18585 [Acidobacteriia bacterium]|nr:hypothetical protein [Terriglobia bacterium]